MSELALKLIREAKEQRLTRLDLGNCGLTELPDELFELVWLEELILASKWEEYEAKSNYWDTRESDNNGTYNQIRVIPYEIKNLTELSKFIAAGNCITDLSSIAKLRQLKLLNLSGSQLTSAKLTPLIELQKLQSLQLSNNLISDLNPLKELKQLQFFDLFSNQIYDLEPIINLRQLRLLDLSANHIIDIYPLSRLYQLRKLDIHSNKIKNLAPLAKLRALQTLDLSSNSISNVEALTELQHLQTLDLSSNRISNIEPLARLEQLKALKLRSNLTEDLTPLAGLHQLQTLYLSSNRISNLEPLKNLIQKNVRISLKEHDYEKNILLFDNPLTNPPKEIVEQGNTAILNYFKALEAQGAEPLNEAKLIIVGEPGAGKTTLMETLLDPDFVLSDTASTLGVEVREGWQFTNPEKSETQFTANIWDFGGQQIQYMTHQFFLTPSAVYVLVSANDRKEPTNFPYWFKIIHLLGEEQGRYSPVLVVLNEKDDKFINKFNFDRKFYEDRYPELQIEVCEVDLSKRNAAYQLMRNSVQRMLSQLPHVTDPRPARWKDIRDALRERAQTTNHISFTEYAAICSEHSVKDETSQLVFSRYLHKLGSLLHFSDDPSLHNFIILKPQWAVDAVYSVLNDNQVAKNDGYFNRSQLETIWKDKYSYDERCKLLNLMQQENFEICYPLSPQDFIAPQLLNAERPQFRWDEKDNLRFRFQYKFMPEGVITRLIVRLNNKLARGIEGKQLIWRKGAVFIEKDCRALVQEEENRDGLKIIDIAINGKVSERKYLLRQISDQIQDIHSKWFRNIKVEQMIPCVCSYCTNPEHKDPKFFEEDVLNRASERGISTVECDKEFIDVSVKSLLEGVFDQQELTKRKANRNARMNRSEPKEPSKQTVQVNVNLNQLNPTPPQPVATAPTTNAEPELPKPEAKWYQDWWFISLSVALIVGGLATWVLPSLTTFLVSTVGMGLVMYLFMNPKRRYFRAASLLLTLFAMPFMSPLFSVVIKSFSYTENSTLNAIVELGKEMNPWVASILGVGALATAAFLFWLDHKQS